MTFVSRHVKRLFLLFAVLLLLGVGCMDSTRTKTTDEDVPRGTADEQTPDPETEEADDPNVPDPEATETEWDKFISWMERSGYHQDIISFYDDIYTTGSESDRFRLDQYFGTKNSDGTGPYGIPEDRVWMYDQYRESAIDDVIDLTVVELYPTEPGWTYKMSIADSAALTGEAIEDYLKRRAGDDLANGLGRQVNLTVRQEYTSYDDLFFADGEEFTLVDDPKTLYKKGNTYSRLQWDEEWEPIETSGYIDNTFSDKQMEYFYDENGVERDMGGMYVFMGGISPENYRFAGVSGRFQTGCLALKNIINCAETSEALTSYVHELGHILWLPHAFVGYEDPRPINVPTTLGGDNDWGGAWPCFDKSRSRTITYSPLERYTIEPYSGFNNAESFVEQYNDIVMCDE